MFESSLPSGEGGGRGFQFCFTMAINYAVTKCKNPKHPETDYFSAKARKTSDYDFNDLVDDVALATTCTRGDAMAVLSSIKPFITKALLAGRRVVLNDLGSFVIGIRSKCYTAETMTEEGFRPSEYIKGWCLHFRPEPKLKSALTEGFQVHRVSSEVMK